MAVSGQEALWIDDFKLRGHVQSRHLLIADDGGREVISNSMQLYLSWPDPGYQRYSIFKGIKLWRFESAIQKLTPEQKAQLFNDIINQAKWDSNTKDALNDFLDKDN